ncbi:unnamed protein product [Sympodiomycopsis kandeliae]
MIPSKTLLAVRTFRSTRPVYALHHGTRHWPSALDGGQEDLNSLQITDPLAIYKAKVARGEMDEDEEQVKALVKLRSLTRRLQDYTPPVHLLGILRAAEHAANNTRASQQEKDRIMTDSQTELVKYLTTQETLSDLDTPTGLMLTGPPGSGKSEILNIWFDSLPIRGKFRRHYHHLLLTLYRLIWVEAEKRRTALRGGMPPTPLATSEKELEGGQYASSGPRRTVLPQRGTGTVWQRGGEHGVRSDGKGSGWRRVLQGMPFFRPDSLSDSDGARQMTENEKLAQVTTANLAAASNTTLPLHAASQLFLNYGPVMLFDEVQLVDVASAGLLKRTLEAYWMLGGVVVGSSNRLPEDLYNNGVQQSQLIQFFEALRTRCPVHEMKGQRDFRRKPGGLEFWSSVDSHSSPSSVGHTTYFVKGQENAFEAKLKSLIQDREPTPTTLKVYNRPVRIPLAWPPIDVKPSIAIFTFAELCDSPLGPADYLTIVSHFEEIVIRDVPQLLLANKNQARRWITFIDAAYESSSRLLILAASKPDDLFFPEARNDRRPSKPSTRPSTEPDDVVDMSARGMKSPFLTPPAGENYPEEDELRSAVDELTSEQLIQSETLSEARQDVEEGFRPNISSYIDPQDSSSKIDTRRAEIEAARIKRENQRRAEEIIVGFPDLAIFSGADERFSYARAVSRLHEMSNPMWKARKRWTPLLETELRMWGVDENGSSSAEKVTVTPTSSQLSREAHPTMASMGDFADEASYEASTFPSRTSSYRDDPTGSASGSRVDVSRSGPVSYNMPSTARSHRAKSAEDSSFEGERAAVGRQQDSNPSLQDAHVHHPSEGPPKISPVHVWGQADWGPKAGKWGKGPSGLKDDSDADMDPSEDLRTRRARLRKQRESLRQ